MRKFLPVVSILAAMIWGYYPASCQEFSELDTLRIIGSGGFPGDTIQFPVDLVNTFPVAGFEFRFRYDSTAFIPISVSTSERSGGFELFGANLTQPGIVVFFATTMRPQENPIPPGRGAVASVDILIRQTALPGSYDLIFADRDSDSYDNSLTDTNSVLVVPILDNGVIEVYQRTFVVGDQGMPDDFSLEQNYPNPFNGETVVSFSLNSCGDVDLEIYDLLGKKVATLFSGPACPGRLSFVWDGRSSDGDALASGIFFYMMRTSWGESVTKRMALLK